MKKFQVLKQPNLLFYCVQKDQVENLKNLTQNYKDEYGKAMSPTKLKEKKGLEQKQLSGFGSDNSLNWNKEEVPEPKSGFIDFTKIFERVTEKRR